MFRAPGAFHLNLCWLLHLGARRLSMVIVIGNGTVYVIAVREPGRGAQGSVQGCVRRRCAAVRCRSSVAPRRHCKETLRHGGSQYTNVTVVYSAIITSFRTVA